MWEMLFHRDKIKNFTGGGRDGVGGSGVVFKLNLFQKAVVD